MSKVPNNGVFWPTKSLSNSTKLPVPQVDLTTITNTQITTDTLTATDGSITNLTAQNLNVTGDISFFHTENTIMADRFVYLGAKSPGSATSSGIISQVQAIGSKIPLTGHFEAGDPGIINTRVGISAGSFLSGECISITGSSSNDGLYEVDSSDGVWLYVRGTGLIPTATQSDGLASIDFTSEPVLLGSEVQKVHITVIKNSATGSYTGSSNNADTLTYELLLTDTNVSNLQNKAISNSTIEIDVIDTSTGTLTLPTGTDNIISRNSTDTVQNKNFIDQNTTFQKWGTPTATGKLDLTALTTQRTYALPDKSGTVATLSDLGTNQYLRGNEIFTNSALGVSGTDGEYSGQLGHSWGITNQMDSFETTIYNYSQILIDTVFLSPNYLCLDLLCLPNPSSIQGRYIHIKADNDSIDDIFYVSLANATNLYVFTAGNTINSVDINTLAPARLKSSFSPGLQTGKIYVIKKTSSLRYFEQTHDLRVATAQNSTILYGDSVVLANKNQSLTNKTIVITDTNFTLQDDINPIRTAKFNCGTLSNSTHTFNLPNFHDSTLMACKEQTFYPSSSGALVGNWYIEVLQTSLWMKTVWVNYESGNGNPTATNASGYITIENALPPSIVYPGLFSGLRMAGTTPNTAWCYVNPPLLGPTVRIYTNSSGNPGNFASGVSCTTFRFQFCCY
jgi:hypothetical protein